MDLTASTLADRLRERDRQARARRYDPLRQAELLALKLTHGDVLIDGEIRTRTEIIDDFVQAIVKPDNRASSLYPEALLTALKPSDKALGDRCRWCVSLLWSRAHSKAPLPWSRASQVLLGLPCKRCSVRLANAVAASAERRERRQRSKPVFEALLAAGTVTKRDSRGRPTRLRTAAVTAAAKSCPDGSCSCGCGTFHAQVASATRAGARSFVVEGNTWRRATVPSYHDDVMNGRKITRISPFGVETR
jgi:hypothetical protein